MAKILLVNYYWPPTGGPCVQRWVDFSNHLVNFGHQVTAVVPLDSGYPIMDESLCQRVNPGVKVVQVGKKSLITKSRGLIGENKLSYFVRGNFFLPDPRKFWNKHVYKYLDDKIEDFDVLITAGPPHSTHLVGLRYAKRIKWIADFHDYWTDAIYIKKFSRTWPAKFIDRRFEKRVMDACSTLLVHSQDAKDILASRTKTPIHVITMGYQKEVFDSLDGEIKVQKGLVSHVGSFFSSYTKGLEFINHLANSGFQVQQVGQVDKGVVLNENIKRVGPVSHSAALEIMKRSEYLVLINPYKHHLPGKIFEYFGAHRPILLVSPDGSEAEKLIKQYKDADADTIFETFARQSIVKKVDKIINEVAGIK